MERQNQKVKILGTEWTVKFDTKDSNSLLDNSDGYCDGLAKIIVIEKNCSEKITQNNEERIRVVTRHEVIHAFLYESGLWTDSLVCEEAWAMNEEMVDWLAIQFPKIADVCLQLKVFA